MIYLVNALYSWLAAAAALGLLVGFVTCKSGKPASWTGWPVFALFLFAAGVAAAWLRVLPGRQGFWLETALLLAAAYCVGCALGCLLRWLFGGSRASQPAPGAALSGLAEETKILRGHAEALAAAAPAALAASSAAQALFSSGAAPAAPVAPTASAPDLAASVKTLTAHAEDLAAAAPAALAASSAAQALLSGAAPATTAAPAASAPDLADSVKALAAHAEDLAAVAPAALAASDAAQKLLSSAPVAQIQAQHADAASVAADSAPPAMERPEHARDEDKLWWIEGVGKKMTRKLHGVGVWRFHQIAAWTPGQARWIGQHFGEPGRVESENWIAQAALLANHGETEFSRAAKAGTVALDEHDEAPVALAAAAPAAAAAALEAEAKSPPPAEPRPERAEDENNLRQILGIGDTLSHELHELGVWRFAQIAAWTPEQQAWISHKLAHCGPAPRESWVAQAQLLAAGVETEHARAVRLGEAHQPHAEALLATLPQVIAPHANDELYAGKRPLSLLHPPLGEKSDLAQIAGVDPEIAPRLNALGVWTYAQIAHWSDMNARWIGSYLAFPGRVERENWIGQARALGSGKTGAA